MEEFVSVDKASNPRLGRREFVKAAAGTSLGLSTGCRPDPGPTKFRSDWHGSRTWIGEQYWANPLQGWRVDGGEVVAQAGAGRTLHLLTHQANASHGGFEMEVTVRLASSGAGEAATEQTWAGFAFGIRGGLPGYQHALVHPATGLTAGLRSDGRVFCGESLGGTVSLDSPVRLKLTVRNGEPRPVAKISAQPLPDGPPAEVAVAVEADALPGNLALAAQGGGRPRAEASAAEWSFRDWTAGGAQLEAHPDQVFGPVLWTQYTLSRRTLKLAAHFPPLGDGDARSARLQLRSGADWATAATATIDPLSRTAIFRVEDWDDTNATEYRVAYSWQGQDHYWSGRVRPNPGASESLRIGVFSCDHGEVFPQHRLVRNVALQDPDLLFFAGDQIYEGYGGFGVARRRPSEEAMLDYLRKYWQFGWTWRSILKDRPSIIIPDDHDVFQGNIWGQGGRALPQSADGWGFENGGFLMEAAWVNAVQRTQAGHLPDAHDPAPCDSGIEVYFTEVRYGGASFAVIEDRKFKTGPADILSPAERSQSHADPSVVDAADAELLGPRQESFLREWAESSADADFRLVCSQTIFCKATTHAGARLVRRVADLDCGGWPQSGRNRALSLLQPARNAIMLAGDQHVGVVAIHGIDQWEDGPLAFMVPGTSNGFPRAWWPEQPGEGGEPDAPAWTGRYRDGLGNRITVLGAANPEPGSNTKEGQAGLDAEEVAHIKGSGHGIVTLDRKAGTATFAIYRHAFDAAEKRSEDQFPGFPIVVELTE